MRISDWSSYVCSSDLLAMAGSMLAVHWVTFFLAVKISGVAVATLGFASFPAFITLCECVFFKEKISIGEWLILLLVTLGLVLVTPSFDLQDDATIGLAWAILSGLTRSEEHTSELQSLMRISYAVFCLKKKHITQDTTIQ